LCFKNIITCAEVFVQAKRFLTPAAGAGKINRVPGVRNLYSVLIHATPAFILHFWRLPDVAAGRTPKVNAPMKIGNTSERIYFGNLPKI